MNIIIEILIGSAKLALGLFVFFCLIGGVAAVRDLIKGRFTTWVRREAVGAVRMEKFDPRCQR